MEQFNNKIKSFLFSQALYNVDDSYCHLIVFIFISFYRMCFRCDKFYVHNNKYNLCRFNHVTMEEAGDYICHAENDAGQTTTTAVVEVQTLPVLTISPHSGMIHVREGERVRLECHATGHPSPTVHWTKHREHYD